MNQLNSKLKRDKKHHSDFLLMDFSNQIEKQFTILQFLKDIHTLQQNILFRNVQLNQLAVLN